MKEKIGDLIEVRKIMALVVVGLFSYLAIAGKLEVNFIQTVIIAVVSFYFGKSTALDMPKVTVNNGNTSISTDNEETGIISADNTKG